VLLAAGGARAQYALEILSLRHRTADQVLATLQPLVEPGGALTGQGNQLFVRTSPGNLAELRRALETIDQPARRLEIAVRFDDSFDASRRSLDASGRIGAGGSRVEVRARDSSTSAQQRVDQRLQVLEGSHAMVYTGQSQPVRERRYIHTPGGVVSQEVTVLQDTRAGFEVVPRLVGSRVQVDIVDANGANAGYTTASGPLGEWFELGSVATAGQTRRVWIKVQVQALP
jgi:hypothetical protein